MEVVREPLPYPHHRGPIGAANDEACSHPEDGGEIARFFGFDECPGCRAGLLAVAVHAPYALVQRELSGEYIRVIDDVRDRLDEFDPMRVLFERALAERGIQ